MRRHVADAGAASEQPAADVSCDVTLPTYGIRSQRKYLPVATATRLSIAAEVL